VWKQAVNSALRGITGYQLQRVEAKRPAPRAGRPGPPKTRSAEHRRVAHRRARPIDSPDRAGPRLRGRAKRLPRHYDEPAVEILRRVQSRTMTDDAKIFSLVEATRYVVREAIPGDFVECGVWRGGSMQAVALALMDLGAADRSLHLFDTFEGMPPPTDKDRRDETTAEELLAAHDKSHRVWAIAGLDDVQEAMREVAYPPELVHFHKGLVEDTIPSRAPEQIALLRLDTDWYESTRHELEHLYDRLSPGGILILDDYGDWEGARLAADEFLTARAESLFLHPAGSGRLAVKPQR
jgi:O-methyltransferase